MSNLPAAIDVDVLRVGDGALLVSDGDQEVWIPFGLINKESDITAESKAGDSGILVIPEWKAYELDLI